jgi:hypothetical protein
MEKKSWCFLKFVPIFVKFSRQQSQKSKMTIMCEKARGILPTYLAVMIQLQNSVVAYELMIGKHIEIVDNIGWLTD